ncbi:MAG: hypothetical protein ACRDRL_19450, partial [Sciscionella sp.]
MRYVRWRRGRSLGTMRAIAAVAKVLSPGATDAIAGLAGPGALAPRRVIGLVGAVGEVADGWFTRREEQTGLLRLSPKGRPIRVRDIADPITLGIHPAAELRQDATGAVDRLPPFIKRDVTRQLEASVRRGTGFVLLVGESTAGKTRSAYEAMRELLPSYKLVFPDTRQALKSLHPRICDNRRVVVWLDDLDHYLGIDGLTPRMVEQMTAAPAHRIIILATMSAAAYSRFGTRGAVEQSDNDVIRNARQILAMASTFRIERAWSETEIDLAREHDSDPRIEAALRHADATRRGVAEYLAAAPDLLNDWQNAWDPGTHPRGAALVAAAVDARRTGYHQALPIAFLERLHEFYLEERGGAALRPEPWEQALA